MIVAGIEFPDNCTSCKLLIVERATFSQSSICTRCPVFVCRMPVTEEDKMYLPMVQPDDYREDWAIEWKKFFDGEIERPRLVL